MSSTDQRRSNSNAPPTPAVRVAVIEDVRDVRESLTVLINGTPGFECSGSYRTMEDALTGVERSRPDVILTDIGLAGMNGIEGTRILRERYPHVPVVALNVYLREHLI